MTGAEEIVALRPLLYGIAYRILGSVHDAEDVLQDAYLRWRGIDSATVGDPRRYLSRVVAHLAMDVLRRRRLAREAYVGTWLPEPVLTAAVTGVPLAPADAVEQRDTLSIATLHLLERLTAPQRAVFVLRTAFGLSFRELAETLGRSVEDCRQLHRRAQARLGGNGRSGTVDRAAHRRLLDALLDAVREGDLDGLARVLAGEVTVWSDGGGRTRAARRPITGVSRAARFLAAVFGPHQGVRFEPTEVNGEPATIIRKDCGAQLMAVAVTDRVTDVYLISNRTSSRS